MQTYVYLRHYLAELFMDGDVSHKIAYFYVQYSFFPPENRAVYEIMWRNMVEPGRPQMTV